MNSLFASTRCRHERLLLLLLAAFLILAGLREFILPRFTGTAVRAGTEDYVNHVAIVTAALDTLQRTHALPLSTDAIYPGIEYPYFLFGNAFFYIAAAATSFVLGLPAYVGAGIVLGLAFGLGMLGMMALAARAGLGPYVAIVLGFLYAAGPYLSVNLMLRLAFPEYLALQLLPALLLVVIRAVRFRAGSAAMFAAAVALALPFYVHKLTAPYACLTLVVLAVSATTWRLDLVPRIALIGSLAFCFSVPSWNPALRGLDPDLALQLAKGGRPDVLSISFANLIWPYAQDSLAHIPQSAAYDGRFGLQIGLIPCVGLLAAIWRLTRGPRVTAFWRLLPAVSLFVIYIVLVLDAFGAWGLMPSPLRYIQFTYRLIGLAHFVGFFLLIYSLPRQSPDRAKGGAGTDRAHLTACLLALAGLGASSYWHPPQYLGIKSHEIRPTDLRDSSAFYTRSSRSTLRTGRAISERGWLGVPPSPIHVTGSGTSIILRGTVPSFMYEGSADPVIIRVYGFEPASESASVEDPVRTWLGDALRSDPIIIAPIRELIESVSGYGANKESATPLPGGEWFVRELASTAMNREGEFELRAPLGPSTSMIAVECSRAVLIRPWDPTSPDKWPHCIKVDRLVPPNEGDRFVDFEPIPPERRSRLTLGSSLIDARGLPQGHYLLPTFDYAFLRVAASDGSIVSTYQYEGQAVIRHRRRIDGYTIWYDLRPEIAALGVGLALFAVSIAVKSHGAIAFGRHRPGHPRSWLPQGARDIAPTGEERSRAVPTA